MLRSKVSFVMFGCYSVLRLEVSQSYVSRLVFFRLGVSFLTFKG